MSLWKVLHMRFLCCLTNAVVDVVLDDITDMFVSLLSGKGQNCGGAR